MLTRSHKGYDLSDENVTTLGLGHYVAVPLRRWRTVAVATVLGLAASLGLIAAVPATYSATAEVNISVITSDPFNTARSASGLIDTPGEARLAGSFSVAERTAASIGGITGQDVRQAIQVVGSADSATLLITAAGSSPERARLIADSVATEYLNYRTDQADARIERTLERSRERLDEAQADLRATTEIIADAEPGSAEAAQADVDRSLLNLEVSSILDEISAAQGIDTSGGDIINPAAAAPVERSPSTTLVPATGLLAGLALGLLAAFALDSRETRIRGRNDLLAAGGGPFVTELTGRIDALLPDSEDLVQLLVMRERLLASRTLAGSQGVVCMAAMPHDEEGTQNIPLATAMVLARGGIDVLYAEVGRSATDGRIQASLGPLAGGRDGDTTVSFKNYPNLRMSLAGEESTDGEPIPESIQQVIREYRRKSLVVLALRAGGSQAAQYAALRASDVTIFVVTTGLTRREELREVVEDARLMGASILGSIMVPKPKKTTRLHSE